MCTWHLRGISGTQEVLKYIRRRRAVARARRMVVERARRRVEAVDARDSGQ